MVFARSTAPVPGAMPLRRPMGSMSTMMFSVTLEAVATSLSRAACQALSTVAIVSGRCLVRRTSRAILLGPTSSPVISSPPMPAADIASASRMVAQETPSAPAAICRLAISGVLCVLACGRKLTPRALAWSAIVRMLYSNASRSRISDGVGRSCFETPSMPLPLAKRRSISSTS